MLKICEDKAQDYLAKTLNKALKLSSNKDHPHYWLQSLETIQLQ